MIFLVDNGSVKVAAYENLRAIAKRLTDSLNREVVAAPLLHADKISADQLGGEKVTLLEQAMEESYSKGTHSFHILPLFFGPSGALVDYLPRRLRKLREQYPKLQVRILNPLFVSNTDGGDVLTEILFQRIRGVRTKTQWDVFDVVLVDHGSPRKEVTEVRNALAELLGEKFENQTIPVTAASMERRKGDEYAFNEPLLETALASCSGERPVILSQLFLSPGRHAGPGGDIESICKTAMEHNPALNIHPTDLVGNHPRLGELLAKRWLERETVPWLEL